MDVTEGRCPQVSVVIPSYNSAEFLPEAIDSALSQDVAPEVIVVDDGSTDNTAELMARYAERRQVRYILQQNRGPAAARNTGVRAARAEYVAVVDSDDALAPRALSKLVSAFERSGAGWSMVDIVKFGSGSREIRRCVTPKEDPKLAILADDFICRMMFFRKTTIERIGMWDENIFGREDWDINIRLLASGEPYVYVQEPLYLYRKRSGSITTGQLHRFLENTERLMHKHHKAAADAGDHSIALIYARHLWILARRYFYEQRDFGASLRCACESLRYDFSAKRVLHPIVHSIRRLRSGMPRQEM
jgi:glycosyltransferase involved in cell wall biosynthesis